MTVITEKQSIPKILVYEELDGLNVYYSGYQTVLNNLQNAESIMGSSGLQSFIIEVVKDFFKSKLKKNYFILSNEVGLHISKRNNLSADIAIFSKENLKIKDLTSNYISVAPTVVIEVDTKADFTNINPADYFNIKTQKLLDFGVQKVVWIYTKSEKIMVATQGSPWLTIDWDKDIEVLGQQINILKMLKEEGY